MTTDLKQMDILILPMGWSDWNQASLHQLFPKFELKIIFCLLTCPLEKNIDGSDSQ